MRIRVVVLFRRYRKVYKSPLSLVVAFSPSVALKKTTQKVRTVRD